MFICLYITIGKVFVNTVEKRYLGTLLFSVLSFIKVFVYYFRRCDQASDSTTTVFEPQGFQFRYIYHFRKKEQFLVYLISQRRSSSVELLFLGTPTENCFDLPSLLERLKNIFFIDILTYY